MIAEGDLRGPSRSRDHLIQTVRDFAEHAAASGGALQNQGHDAARLATPVTAFRWNEGSTP
jgi:hypothetical protein